MATAPRTITIDVRTNPNIARIVADLTASRERAIDVAVDLEQRTAEALRLLDGGCGPCRYCVSRAISVLRGGS